MTRFYRAFQLGALLLLLAACSASDQSQNSALPTDNDGTARLSWEASIGRNLAGYKIYSATTSGGYGPPIATTSMDVTTYTATDLAPGTTYFFVVTAFNADGAESTVSNEVSTAIP
ncbi:MAG: fibronectin type III domain-containing protein [Nitrospira sp.]|nr:fibronectin type III domain-containing protein [Nitrospira sp.]